MEQKNLPSEALTQKVEHLFVGLLARCKVIAVVLLGMHTVRHVFARAQRRVRRIEVVVAVRVDAQLKHVLRILLADVQRDAGGRRRPVVLLADHK